MASEAEHLGMENLQLIDFSEEDDYLIAYPFRDSLQDLRLSVTFDNANEHDRFKLFGLANSGEVVKDSQALEGRDHIQSESVEPRRPSFLRKSLAWDSAFFTSAGVLDPEELFMINKGFKKAHNLSPGIRKAIRPHRAAELKYSSLDGDGSSLKALEADLFEDVKPCIHKLCKRSKVASDIGGPGFGQANTFSSKKMNICSLNKVKPVAASRIQGHNLQGTKCMTKKSVGPQNTQDIMRTEESSMPPSRPPTISGHAKLASPTQTKMASLERADTDDVKMENKTRKAGSGPDLKMSKRSRLGDLSGPPKSASFTSPTTKKDSKVSCSYESSSSASSSKYSSKAMRRKMSPRNSKQPASTSSMCFSLLSTCSSSSSPASSTDGWSSESLSSTSITNQLNASRTCFTDYAIQASDCQSHLQAPSSPCQKIEETKFTNQCAARASIGTSPFPGGPKPNVRSSGLKMPSPKIGFFDEEQSLQPNLKGSRQFRFGGQSPLPNENKLNKVPPFNLSPSMSAENCLKVGKVSNREHDRRKVGGRLSRLKPDGETKTISKNKMMIERKRQKDDYGSFQGEAIINPCKKKHEEVDQCFIQQGGKENMCSFEDQVTGLSKHLEVIDLDKDVVEVKSQQIHEPSKLSPLSLPTTAESTPPRSRTPLAEKRFCKH